MIKIINITDDIVKWSDDDGGPYTYPRCMFPDRLTLECKIEYSAGEFNYMEE
jgi:hypothetical protein